MGLLHKNSSGISSVDTAVDFNIGNSLGNNRATAGSQFLEDHRSDVLCGPVKLVNYVDMVGQGGFITLTSPQLLKARLRSLLLHIQAIPKEADQQENEVTMVRLM